MHWQLNLYLGGPRVKLAVESQRLFLAQTGSVRNTEYGNLSATRRIEDFFPSSNERLEQKASELSWPERIFRTNGNAALCHYVYLSHHQGDGGTMALSVPFHHRLLLSIIRLPNVTDDEKDSSENLSLGPSKSKQKKSNPLSAPGPAPAATLSCRL